MRVTLYTHEPQLPAVLMCVCPRTAAAAAAARQPEAQLRHHHVLCVALLLRVPAGGSAADHQCAVPWPVLTLYLSVHSKLLTTPLLAAVWHQTLAHMATPSQRLHPHSAACSGSVDLLGAAGTACRGARQDQHKPRDPVQQRRGGICAEPGGVPAHWQNLGADDEHCWCVQVDVFSASGLLHSGLLHSRHRHGSSCTRHTGSCALLQVWPRTGC